MAGDIEPSCAICGAPPYPTCPHEDERMELAIDQAQARWTAMQGIRDWVLNNARDQVMSTFQQLRLARYQLHLAYLQSLPCFTLYYRYNGQPPMMQPAQLHMLHSQITQANALFKQGVDEDWRRSCLQYPEVLDYYFNRVGYVLPDETDPSHGVAAKERPRVKAKKEGIDAGSAKDAKRKESRRSRGTTPPAPPRAPMPGAYR
ncbi:hypothetical protein LTR08_007562 [Meristemomyces frigidus]|nr:hypothetical protein LTR08_007562 [Meristemomyces frigidus]